MEKLYDIKFYRKVDKQKVLLNVKTYDDYATSLQEASRYEMAYLDNVTETYVKDKMEINHI